MNNPFGPALVAYNGYRVGLGNRVRVTLGCKSLAESEGRAFYYVWPTGKHFGPRFSDIWDFSGTAVPRSLSRALAYRWDYVDHTLAWLDDAKRRERLWQIRTGTELHLPERARSWRTEFRDLRPTPQIADRVHAFYDAQLRGVPYLGVNIRAHAVSHQQTRDSSPVEWYVNRLLAIRHDHPDLPFFISCDVPEVQQRLCREVAGCVGQVDKGGYNTVDGINSSVVDLYLLASSGYLVGPHFSSFINLAEHLADDLLALETPVDGPSEPVDLGALSQAPDPLRPALRPGVRSATPGGER